MTNTDSYRLVASQNKASKAIFQRMLVAGLLQKQHAAEMALELTKPSQAATRQKLSQLVGNQGRYKRLDADGRQGSREIKRLREKLRQHRHAASQDEVGVAQQLQLEIDSCVQRHETHPTLNRVSTLRRDIRSLLQQGALRSH